MKRPCVCMYVCMRVLSVNGSVSVCKFVKMYVYTGCLNVACMPVCLCVMLFDVNVVFVVINTVVRHRCCQCVGSVLLVQTLCGPRLQGKQLPDRMQNGAQWYCC